MRRLAKSIVVGSLLAPVTVLLPVVSLPTPTPEPVRPRVQQLDLDGALVRSSDPLRSGELGGGQPERFEAPSRDVEPFRLMGVTWDAGAGDDVGIEVRVRTDGQWSPWTELEPADQGPDAGTADVGTTSRRATEPLWTGSSADGVDVRISAPVRPRGVQLELVEPGHSSADETLGRARTVGGPGATARAVSPRPDIIPRSAWGADEQLRLGACPSGPQYSKSVKVAFVHHTATSNSYGPGESAAIIRGIYAYHVQSNGWCDIAYNFLVDRYGQIFEGRFGGPELPVIGGHTGGFNTDSFGVAMIGTFDTAPPANTRTSVERVLAWKLGGSYRDMHGSAQLTSRCVDRCRYPSGAVVTFPTIAGHRDASLTSCPGDGGYAILGSLRDRAAALAGDRSANAIYQHWQRLGGEGGWLGGPYFVQHPVAAGQATRFNGGAVYWTPAVGAREVHGGILDRYVAFGGPWSPLAFPVTDEHAASGGGRFNFFEGGAIFYRSDLGAREVHGGIYRAWDRLNREVGLLGYPTADEAPIAGGAFSQFERGNIYWSGPTDAREVHGGILADYLLFGGPGSPLGFPLTDEQPALGTGRFNFFRGGAIFWRPDLGANEVHGGIYRAWDRLNREVGLLGYPIADEAPITGGALSRFERGHIYWSAATDAHEVHGGILSAYLAEGGPTGRLGYPTTDEYRDGLRMRSDFVRGSITYNPATGETDVIVR